MIRVDDSQFNDLQRKVEDQAKEIKALKNLVFKQDFPSYKYLTKGLQMTGDLQHNGSRIGFYKATAVEQAEGITDVPTGGSEDIATNALAINSLITALENVGIIKTIS